MNAKWKPIATAPKNATDVSVRMKDGTVYKRAHWASDLSGEDQPPFEGWFVPNGKHLSSGFTGIAEPKEWRPIRRKPVRTVFGRLRNQDVGLKRLVTFELTKAGLRVRFKGSPMKRAKVLSLRSLANAAADQSVMFPELEERKLL